MKKVSPGRKQQQQAAGAGGRGRLRLPGMLSVAVVSGLLSTVSCGSSGPVAQDGAQPDADASAMQDTPPFPDTSPDRPSSPDIMAMADVPSMPDAGVDTGDDGLPHDVVIDRPVL